MLFGLNGFGKGLVIKVWVGCAGLGSARLVYVKYVKIS